MAGVIRKGTFGSSVEGVGEAGYLGFFLSLSLSSDLNLTSACFGIDGVCAVP